jgi:3-dehydroquinate dehydratase/shikimate dehydrogenase
MKAHTINVAPQFLLSRMGKLCVAIGGSTPNEMVEQAALAVKESPFLEFRLDYLQNPLAAMPRLKQFLAEHSEATAVATCRRASNGGKFKGNVAAEMEVLQKAADAGFQLVDIEMQTALTLKHGEMDSIRAAGAAIIVSYHDFEATRDLDGTFEKILPLGAEFVKIVPTAKCLADNITLMRFLERTVDNANVIGICMGDYGVISRVLGVRAGSIFTFAAAATGAETGPGQIAARTLRETYRIDQVDAATKVYGVAGNPVKHSLSPIMMNTAFRRETENRVYLGLQTSKLTDLLKLVNEIPLQGLSITMPFKEEILKHLAKTDPLSAKIGACNTVVRAQDGNLYGFNTDVAGIVGPLEKRLHLRGAKVLVLGAGGAARAAVFGLKDKGADVYILNRTAPTAQKLARQAGAKTIKREAVAKTQFDVILNATPIGMAGFKTQTLLEPKELNARLVFDLVYNPVETPLIRMARQKGIPIITGIEMFVQQGARQFEIWTGKPAPEQEMLRVVIHALQQQQGAAQPVAVAAPARLAEPKAAEPEDVAEDAPVVVEKKAAAPAKAVAPAKAAAAKAVAPVKKAAAPVTKTAAPAKKVAAKTPVKKAAAPAKKPAAKKKK